MTVAGLIFSNKQEQGFPEMTRRRTTASIPFACRYRLIDFPLSNMVNSDITTIALSFMCTEPLILKKIVELGLYSNYDIGMFETDLGPYVDTVRYYTGLGPYIF